MLDIERRVWAATSLRMRSRTSSVAGTADQPPPHEQGKKKRSQHRPDPHDQRGEDPRVHARLIDMPTVTAEVIRSAANVESRPTPPSSADAFWAGPSGLCK
jgi:hypothetical protein